MSDDPWLPVIDQADIEAALQRKKSRDSRLVEQEAEITRLRAELATARREGMEQAAKIAFDYALRLENMAELTRYPHVKREHEGRSWVAQKIAAAIRAAAKEGKP